MRENQKICCGMMLCQMTAILSCVSMLYLAVIVVIPGSKELLAGFNREPIMCTTVKAVDISSTATKIGCPWSTCSEWCLAGTGTPCMQIKVLARNKGSGVTFRKCVDVKDKSCSALDVNLTLGKRCKKGECRELNGVYNCTKDKDNICREITPAFNCDHNLSLNPKTIFCDEYKCEERLNGVYSCRMGTCNRLDHVNNYVKDCERKCNDLRLSDINVAIFSRERLITTNCMSVESADNNSVSSLNTNQQWKDKSKVLFLYCTHYRKSHSERSYDLHTGDCFNATLGDASMLSNVSNYLHVLDYVRVLHNRSEWLIKPEHYLTLRKDTQLRINPEGCVNSLRKECKEFFSTHATDGSDGRTQDRFPCYFSNQTSSYVIGKYSPDLTFMYMMVASILPACLFVFSCTCLFVCSKSVGIDDRGRLKRMPYFGASHQVDKNPVHFDELL